MIIYRKIRSFLKLDRKTIVLCLIVFPLMGFFRMSILFFPFKKVANRMGKIGEESSSKYDYDKHEYIMKVSYVVNKMSRYTPWESLCLVQALTAQVLLNAKKIDTTIYLGISKQEKKMLAHAWLRCGDKILTGGKEMNEFKQIAMFASVRK